jgi:hypothetical protein
MFTLIMMMALSSSSPVVEKPLPTLILSGADKRGEVFQSQIKTIRGRNGHITGYGTQMWVTIRVTNADMGTENSVLPAMCREMAVEAINPAVALGYKWGFYKYPQAISIETVSLEIREGGFIVTCQVRGWTAMRDNKQGK